MSLFGRFRECSMPDSLNISPPERPGSPGNSASGTIVPGMSTVPRTSGLPKESTDRRPSPTTSSTPADSLSLLRQIVRPCQDFASLQRAVAGFIRQQIRTPLIAWYFPAGPQIGQQSRIESLLCPTDGISAELQKQLHDSAIAANQSQRLRVTHCGESASLHITAVPLVAPEGHCLLVVHEAPPPLPSESRAILLLSLCAITMEEWMQRRTAVQAAADASSVAAMVELIGHVHAATDAESACGRLADSLQKYLSASTVFIGLSRSVGAEPQLRAISNQSGPDPLSELSRLGDAALHESVVRAATAVWPAHQMSNRHSLLAHAQLAASLKCRFIVSVPLLTETGSGVGAILATFGEPISERNQGSTIPATAASARDAVADSENFASAHLDTFRNAEPADREDPVRRCVEQAERFLRAGSVPLTGCLQVIQSLADSRILHMIRKFRRWCTREKLKTAGVASLVVLVAMLIPMPYAVRCRCELQPIERRYVAAPFAGPLNECLVEPGDLVQESQLLARMDGREIHWELAGTQADLNKATKERNTHLSTHEFGHAAIARLEVERLQNRTDLLQHRDSSLEIRSPISGVVVTGDHREAEGIPLEAGQSLFEIAPLERMVIEVCIPEEDIRHVAEGQTVRVQLDAVPETIFEAAIRRIHPRSELRDNENVFVAEAELSNEELRLRPGMRGSAKVLTDRHVLGWNLFHKPWAHVVGWLGW